jgi:hypothetical protein
MRGPEIIRRTLSRAAVRDKHGNHWQYHSRSDHHSKVACWAIAFDLLSESNLLRSHVAAGKVTFGINRQLNDYETGKKKNLDLVVARTPDGSPSSGNEVKAFDLVSLAQQYRLDLTDDDRAALDELPSAQPGLAGATVLVALEAKACMTAHVRALPRLHDELTSSHSIVHGDTPNALSVGFVMINMADRFVSPDLHRRPITNDSPVAYSAHRQPHDTERTLGMLKEVRRRSGPGSNQRGFDALGIMLVDMPNDGAEVQVITSPPAPSVSSPNHYDRMIQRAGHLYDVTFSQVV